MCGLKQAGCCGHPWGGHGIVRLKKPGLKAGDEVRDQEEAPGGRMGNLGREVGSAIPAAKGTACAKAKKSACKTVHVWKYIIVIDIRDKQGTKLESYLSMASIVIVRSPGCYPTEEDSQQVQHLIPSACDISLPTEWRRLVMMQEETSYEISQECKGRTKAEVCE